MSYVRINSTVEYDPATNTVRQDGQTRPAGLAALAFSTVLEVQQQLRAQSPEAPAGDTPVAPAAVVPQLTASGAPLITLRATPASNPWNYSGPAARNPYYIVPGVPLEDGLIKGYENWFESAQVGAAGSSGAGVAYTMRVVTAEGAQEALRLVQEYVPEATLEATVFGAQGGPWCADKPTYYVALPGGAQLNAAAILDSYYSRGQGVTALSDLTLRDELRWQAGNPGLGAG
jgi:hypothetical protein